jgi:hypothetical protein
MIKWLIRINYSRRKLGMIWRIGEKLGFNTNSVTMHINATSSARNNAMKTIASIYLQTRKRGSYHHVLPLQLG